MVHCLVYCKIKERKENFAVYSIGTSIDDITGEVVFYKGYQEPMLVKQAEKFEIKDIHIAKILQKHMCEFKKGIFKDKLSFEIG